MEHTAAPSLHTCSRPRAPPARIITQCCSYDTDGHRPSAAELVQTPPIVMLILLCKKIFAWVDKVSLWNLSKIRAAFQTTFDRQPKRLATCPWTGSVTHWRQPQLHSLSFSLAPSIPCCYPKMNFHLQHSKIRKKIWMCFQYTTYIICKLCCWYLYIEPAVKIHMTGIDSTFFSQLEVYATSTSVRFFWFFFSSCFTLYLEGNEVVSDNIQ